MNTKIVAALVGLFTFVAIGEAGKFFNIHSHRYYLSNPLKKNWYEALRYCIYHGMVLVDINSEEENIRLLSIIQPKFMNDTTSEYWTSGTDEGSEGNFYWASSGHSIMYSNWNGGQPDNAGNNEHCLEIRSNFGWKWNDHWCMEKKYFICRNSVSYPFANPNCITSLGRQ